MRFMMMIKMSKDPAAGKGPSKEGFEIMGKYNEQLAKSGVLLDMGGLQATAKGAKIHFGEGGKKTVIDGPFTESKELVAGYWLIKVKSIEEAIEWAKRTPTTPGQEIQIEVRQFIEFGED